MPHFDEVSKLGGGIDQGQHVVGAAAPVSALAQHLRQMVCGLGIHSFEVVSVSFHAGPTPDKKTLACRVCRAEITRPR